MPRAAGGIGGMCATPARGGGDSCGHRAGAGEKHGREVERRRAGFTVGLACGRVGQLPESPAAEQQRHDSRLDFVCLLFRFYQYKQLVT